MWKVVIPQIFIFPDSFYFKLLPNKAAWNKMLIRKYKINMTILINFMTFENMAAQEEDSIGGELGKVT